MKHKVSKLHVQNTIQKINTHGHTDTHVCAMQNFVYAMNNISSTFFYVTNHGTTQLPTTDSDCIRN
jgi:hypothetical protein